MTEWAKKYSQLGVSASKSGLKQALAGLPPVPFPCFVRCVRSPFSNKWAALHSDTAGTKSALAYLWWKESGEVWVWHAVTVDALVMNIDDLACGGFTGPFLINSVIARNSHLIPDQVIENILQATLSFAEEMHRWGVEIVHGGGETADVPVLVRTIDIGFTAYSECLHPLKIELVPGCVIVGFASWGRCYWENKPNSGIGSNGLTLATHTLLHPLYMEKYPEIVNPHTPPFSGRYLLSDTPAAVGHSVAESLLSATRTYTPLIKALLQRWRPYIRGLIHCTGGGQTKVLHFVPKGLHIVKDNPYPPPPLFKLIKEEGSLSWEEMYAVFNMGWRLEAYISERAVAEEVLAWSSEQFGIEARIVGYSQEGQGKCLLIVAPDGTLLRYEPDH